jgi:hypothetical protein
MKAKWKSPRQKDYYLKNKEFLKKKGKEYRDREDKEGRERRLEMMRERNYKTKVEGRLTWIL